jgi:hypothetical protein
MLKLIVVSCAFSILSEVFEDCCLNFKLNFLNKRSHEWF